VLDRQPPAQQATGAALGVLMGIISQKTKGNAWKLRQTSIQRYATLIPELEAAGQVVPCNQQGILLLCFAEDDLTRWEALVKTRQAQGWQLEIWDSDRLQTQCPQVLNSSVTAAIYSPGDRQIDPTALTLALVAAAQQKGVTFEFDRPVEDWELTPDQQYRLHTPTGALLADRVVIAAGIGSTDLTRTAPQPLDIRPVLGQAMRVRLAAPLGNPDFQPVVTGNDIHIVPLGNCEYWVGATVEFPSADGIAIEPDPDRLHHVLRGAIDLCPALATAEILHTWSGLRPRPYNRPAPIIEPLTGCHHIWLATGHYRNGILLAPATAEAIRAAIVASL
jgi:glycine/D-amino acid oxidase-like deaminating enzyme